MCYWKNDILPFFGKMRMVRVTPSDMESFLIHMRGKRVRNRPKTPEVNRPFLSEKTVGYVYTLVHCFFKKAVQWKDLKESPITWDKPTGDEKLRDFWQPEKFTDALTDVEDELLHLAIHIAFRCTMRIGEICALNWDNLNFADREISIERNMQRVTLDAIERASSKKILHVYPAATADSKSRLILTTPKSDYGIRVNKMSAKLCEELQQRKKNVMLDKQRYGDKYQDNNLVFCFPDGRPIEPGRLSRKFVKWQKQNGLDHVDFHSIRITSCSLKLVVSGGDIKSAQRDLGDKTPHMVTHVYGRSLDKHHAAMNDKVDESIYGPVLEESNVSVKSIDQELLLKMLPVIETVKMIDDPELRKSMLSSIFAQVSK